MPDDGRSQLIEQILKTIEFGDITYTEAERRIEQIIDEEASGTDKAANPELITACESLLFQLRTHGAARCESHAARSWILAQQRYSEWKDRRSSFWHVVRFAVAIVVLCVCLGVGGAVHWRWFTHTTTLDEQQHLVQGHELQFRLIQQAIAEYQDVGFFEFMSSDEINNHFGFDLRIPDTINGIWKTQKISVFYFPESIQVVASYLCEDQRNLVFSQFYYTNYEEAALAFEQNREGDSTKQDGLDVYYSCNERRRLYVWTEQGVVYYLSGDIGQEDGWGIVDTLRK